MYRSKTLRNYTNPITLLDYLLAEVVKCALESVVTSSTHVLIKSLDSPLYIRSSGIHFPITEMHAKTDINSLFLSYLFLLIRPESNASLALILFKERLKPIIKPFSSKLYMFSAVIQYFLMTIVS